MLSLHRIRGHRLSSADDPEILSNQSYRPQAVLLKTELQKVTDHTGFNLEKREYRNMLLISTDKCILYLSVRNITKHFVLIERQSRTNYGTANQTIH